MKNLATILSSEYKSIVSDDNENFSILTLFNCLFYLFIQYFQLQLQLKMVQIQLHIHVEKVFCPLITAQAAGAG